MATYSESSDRISINQLDVRILTALLLGPTQSYDLLRRCEVDSKNDDRISHGAYYRTLKSLVTYGLVEQDGLKYAICAGGKTLLESEAKSMKHLVELMEERS